MKKIAFLLMVCLCVLNPAVARADDGGFWDMLFHWDTKFSGYGTEFHVLCLTKSGQRVHNCEEWFKKIRYVFRPRDPGLEHAFTTYQTGLSPQAVEFEDITHEFNFRGSLMISYGDRIPDVEMTAADMDRNKTNVYASKLIAFYNYRVDSHWNVGAGAGVIPVFGKHIDPLWRGIATVGTTYFPASVNSRWGMWYVRVDGSYLTNTMTGADLGFEKSAFRSGPKFNLSATVGFDVRRVGRVTAAAR